MSLSCRLSPNSDLLFIIVPTPQGMSKNKNTTYFLEAEFKYRLIISLEFRANPTRSICIYQFELGWLLRC